jgi:hypothetical protein
VPRLPHTYVGPKSYCPARGGRAFISQVERAAGDPREGAIIGLRDELLGDRERAPPPGYPVRESAARF